MPTTTEPPQITARAPSPEIKCMDLRLVQARPLCECLAPRWRQSVVQAYFAGRPQSGITFEQCREEFV
jgi:hypothetical protein